MTQFKNDLYFALKFAPQELSKYNGEVTPTTVTLVISVHILHPCRKLQLFSKQDKGIAITADDETSYTTQCQQSVLNHVGNEYCAKHRQL